MRMHGSGSVERQRSGRYVARLPRIFGRRSVGCFDTEEEAHRELDLAIARLVEGHGAVGDGTLRGWGAAWLDRRELGGSRNVATDRSRWGRHVMRARFADWPLPRIRRRDVRAWVESLRATAAADKRGARQLSAKTVRECLLLLRRCLQDAVDEELIDTNPADRIRVKRPAKIEHQAWTFLDPDEQRLLKLCTTIPEPDRLRALFAIGTGLRQGEQWNLELVDVHVVDAPHVVVRYGGPNHEPPKNNRIRRVPLFGLALKAARRWLRLLPDYCPDNPFGLMWPTERGCRRQRSKSYGWPEHQQLAGIRRGVRWHDLRHTCASSLVAGWWGERWTLQEVAALLGHSSVTVTERYAHLAQSAIRERADRTPGARGAQQVTSAHKLIRRNLERFRWLRGQDLNLRPSGYEGDAIPSDGAGLDPRAGQALGKLVKAYAGAVLDGDVHAHDRGLDLAEAVAALARQTRSKKETA